MKVLGVIPARYQSTRFPGKPLIDIAGKSMIQRVYERASGAKSLTGVVVATDDQRIADHVHAFGGQAKMTNPNHPSGSDRCAEVSATSSYEHDVVINIQGDEPLIQPEQIDAVSALFEDPDCAIGTLARTATEIKDLDDPNKVKIALDRHHYALYFSRSPIPHLRGIPKENWLKENDFHMHVGIYGYRKDTLKRLSGLSLGTLEKAESLEQLRWLENNIRIKVGFTSFQSIGVDHPEDLQRILQLLKQGE